jgi:hypothetical protein
LIDVYHFVTRISFANLAVLLVAFITRKSLKNDSGRPSKELQACEQRHPHTTCNKNKSTRTHQNSVCSPPASKEKAIIIRCIYINKSALMCCSSGRQVIYSSQHAITAIGRSSTYFPARLALAQLFERPKKKTE